MAHNHDEEFDFDEDEDETEEEHNARMLRAKAKFNNLIGEMADELMSEKQFKKFEKLILHRMHHSGIALTTANLKIFVEGFEFGAVAIGKAGQENLAPLIASLHKMVRVREEKKAAQKQDTMKIDIQSITPTPSTKSKRRK